MSDTKEKLANYIDAGVPILYINSFEENKTDGLIKEVLGDRKAFEWNLSLGVSDFKTGERQSDISLKAYLKAAIDNGLEDELNRRVLLIKDYHQGNVPSGFRGICEGGGRSGRSPGFCTSRFREQGRS